MLKQTVVWTAVPNGVEAGLLKVVGLASPRLSSDGIPPQLTLELFPDFKNWATTAAAITFNIRIGNNPPMPATRVSQPPKPELWSALFTPETYVRPFQFSDHTAKNIRSYPAANVADAIAQFYKEVAMTSPTEFPLASVLLGDQLPGRIAMPRGRDDERGFLDLLNGRYANQRALPPGPADPVMDFLQVKAFHLVTKGAQPVEPKVTPEQLDFHQVLALLAEYPAVQRLLGLVVDLTVPVPAGMPANTTVQLVPVWQPGLAGSIDRTLVTSASYAPDRFLPADAGDVKGGAIDLSSGAFAVTPIDVDGAALKVRQFADNVKQAWTVAKSGDTPDRYALPALRGGGLAVIRTGRAAQQAAKFTTAKSTNGVIVGGGNPTLDAAGLLHGVRWHVYDVGSGRWYSLCQRTGDYEFAKLGLKIPIGGNGTTWEEGAVTAAATQRVDGSGPDFYLAEYVARWHGDSLVAPRPGNWLDRDPGQPPTSGSPGPHPEFPLRALFTPQPGSLPPLRYGRAYRLRARAAFIGGAGLSYVPGDPSSNFAGATAEVTFARLEPVPPPHVVRRKPRTAGDSVHRLVIRTDFDLEGSETTPTERHILPPKIAQLDAERHGMFDGPNGMDASTYEMIKARADGALTAGDDQDPVFDVDQPSFPVEGGSTAQVPWLPDPLARGVAFFGLPGAPAGSVHTVSFGNGEPGVAWPSLLPARLRLVEGPDAPAPLPDGRGLQVSLDKGDVAHVQVSCHPYESDLRSLQIWRWVELEANLPPAIVDARRVEARNGRNWLLTPRVPVVLICAVRRPLVAPKFSQATATRPALGATYATLTDTLEISRKSTVSVDLQAEWTDWVDEVEGDVWHPAKPVTRTADLGEIRVNLAGGQLNESTLPVQRRHDVGDTRHHLVTYSAVAKSRFAEYFAEHATPVLPAAAAVLVDNRGIAPNSEEVRSADGNVRYVAGVDYTVDYPAGTLARVPTGTIAENATVELRYTPTVSRPSDPKDRHAIASVECSARPAVARPLYCVPTFGWDLESPSPDPTLPGHIRSRRLGNGIRVYLDRPWWSSGNGEQLGVVLLNSPSMPERLRHLVTQWGLDPVFKSTAPGPTLPQQQHFPQRVASPAPVSLAEVPGQLVLVAPHEVHPDLDRRLWYCDIELAPGPSYFPFVRLALARYQPNAMDGAQLSRIVLADFAQLAPDRSVTLNYSGVTNVGVAVVGFGPQGTKGNPSFFNRMVATVERRTAGVPGDLGWEAAGDVALAGNGWSGGQHIWNGNVHLPAPRGSEPMRIVVREYERFSANSAEDRLVFTDIVDVA